MSLLIKKQRWQIARIFAVHVFFISLPFFTFAQIQLTERLSTGLDPVNCIGRTNETVCRVFSNGEKNGPLFCPADMFMCGMQSEGRDNKGTVVLNIPICCTRSQMAIDAGMNRFGPAYLIDSSSQGAEVMCNPGDILTGAEWGKESQDSSGQRSQQLDFGYCDHISNTQFSSRYVMTANQTNTKYYCPLDALVCGGKNAPAKNDSWNTMYCCYIEASKVKIIAFEDPDQQNEIPGIAFVLNAPDGTDIPENTTYEIGIAKPGSYTLTVPVIDTRYATGYSCTLYSTADATEADCTGGTATANVTAGTDVTFYIKFKKDAACVPKTCQTLGLVCGTFADGCKPCIQGDPDPLNTAGCLQCGQCTGTGAVCNAQGQCVSPLEVGCSVSPGSIEAGNSATFASVVNNGTEPLTCVWQSASTLLDGKTSCTFSEMFASGGTFQATVTVTDSSNPAKSGSASCSIVVTDEPQPPVDPPEPEIPNYALCEVWRLLVLYGLPLFAIMAVLSGLLIILSFGNPQRVEKGKMAFGASVSGLLLLIFAKPIFVSIITFLGFSVFLCGTRIP